MGSRSIFAVLRLRCVAPNRNDRLFPKGNQVQPHERLRPTTSWCDHPRVGVRPAGSATAVFAGLSPVAAEPPPGSPPDPLPTTSFHNATRLQVNKKIQRFWRRRRGLDLPRQKITWVCSAHSQPIVGVATNRAKPLPHYFSRTVTSWVATVPQRARSRSQRWSRRQHRPGVGGHPSFQVRCTRGDLHPHGVPHTCARLCPQAV